MDPISVDERFETPEARMTALEHLPPRIDRLELQIQQLRAAMRDDFSAGRDDLRAGDDRVTAAEQFDALNGKLDASRAETRTMFEQLMSRLAAIEILSRRACRRL